MPGPDAPANLSTVDDSFDPDLALASIRARSDDATTALPTLDATLPPHALELADTFDADAVPTDDTPMLVDADLVALDDADTTRPLVVASVATEGVATEALASAAPSLDAARAAASSVPPASDADDEPSAVGPDGDLGGIEAAVLHVAADDPRRETLEDPRIPVGKQFFKIGEVARITGVKPYVLRYWETEFSWIKPTKTSARQRLYRRQDVALILEIRRLRHEEQRTIAEAKECIRARKLRERTLRSGRTSRPRAADGGSLAAEGSNEASLSRDGAEPRRGRAATPSRIAEALAHATIVSAPSARPQPWGDAPRSDLGHASELRWADVLEGHQLLTRALELVDRLVSVGAETLPPLYVPEPRVDARAAARAKGRVPATAGARSAPR
jgi:DNA-binding transcriptional MerR regulator